MQTMPPACILAGGLGTRLRTLYPDRPKALVPLGGRPFIEWQVSWLARYGITRIHIAAGYLGEQLRQWAQNAAPARDLHLTVSVEPEPLGTAGGLAYAVSEALGRPRRIMVLNGDTLLPAADLRRLAEVACPEGGAVMAVVEVPDAARFGTVEMDAAGRISGFREKGAAGPGPVNGGVYLLDGGVLSRIPRSGPSSLEHDIFPRLAEAGLLLAWTAPPPLLDIGTPEGLRNTGEYLRQEGGRLHLDSFH